MDVYNIFKKYKLKIKEDQIFDSIRCKFVKLTPEERVRQKTLCFLMNYLKVPKDKLCVEVALSTFGLTNNRKRIDIGIFDDKNQLIGIVECKAELIGYNDSPFLQAIDYVTLLNVKYYFVADGEYFQGYYYDSTNDQFVKLEAIPMYDELFN